MAQNTSNNAISGISCDVRNCEYHQEGHKCVAREIKVGPGYATSSSDTICATFKPNATGTTM